MSLTAIGWLESARRKFFMKPTYIMSRKEETNGFGLEMSLTAIRTLQSERIKFFMNTAYIMSRK